MQDLGTLPGHVESYAYGVNDSGHVVGYSGSGFLNQRAFLRTTGAMQNLGTLGGNRSRALAVNNPGDVVGSSETSIYIDHAFLFSNGTMNDLGTIGGNPNGNSVAVDINDKGQIVGTSTVGNDLFTVHATLWRNGKPKDLGALPGYPYSYGKGINNAGHVVGLSSVMEEGLSGDEKRAFLYRGGRMLNLNDALPKNTPWVRLQANSINDDGVIVGTGKLNGELRGFLLTPLQ
jgi:probable HAF family extracellular repeat protein